MKNNLKAPHFIFLVLVFAACSTKDFSPAMIDTEQSIIGNWQLHNVVWNATIVSICDSPQQGRRSVEIRFSEKDFQGQNVVNSIGGNYIIDREGGIQIQNYGGTKIAGTTNEMACEHIIDDLMRNAYSYKIHSTADLPSKNGEPRQRFLVIGRVNFKQETFDPEGKYLIFKEIN